MILDDVNEIKKLDKSAVYKSIETLADQIRQVLKDSRLLANPYDYRNIKQIVVNGMGASNLGAGIIKSVFANDLKLTIIITPGYEVPANVDANTLYILSSYSGGTEEVLSVYKEVKKRKAKIMVLTAAVNGKLEQLMKKENLPGYAYKPEFNPSGVPRIGLGYNVFGLIALLASAGFIKINKKNIEKMVDLMELHDRLLRPEIKLNKNKAKKLAVSISGKIPVFVGAEFLIGNLRVLRNQFCESGKNFATYLTLPELNHYAMEGLAFPVSNKDNLIFFFVDSKFYHPRIQKRSELTKAIIKKNKIKYIELSLSGEDKLSQAFELLQVGTWASYYLGIINKKNPSTNPWVDWFKEKLA